ncbi:MAG: agmatinase family protein [Chloroflexi bacterium]|nr:agmatinase family protein [Chloroflexota bacterium]
MPLNRDPLPAFAGILTMLRAPKAEVEDLKEGMVAILGVPYDLSTTGRIGARFGPRSMRETATYYASHIERGDLIEVTTGQVLVAPKELRLVDLGDLNVYPVDWPKTEAALREAIARILERGAFPVVLGGDHFISYPLTLGLHDAILRRGGRRIGYIQVSNRLDLGQEDPLWGRVWTGATARRVLESGAVDPRNMVWLGAHGYVPLEQLETARELDLRVFTLGDMRRGGIRAVARQAVEVASQGCDAVYLSLDMGVVNGSYAAGTAAPSFDGLRDVELLEVMDELAQSPIGALDIVGVNPTVEFVYHTTQRLAVTALIRFIAPRVLGGTV